MPAYKYKKIFRDDQNSTSRKEKQKLEIEKLREFISGKLKDPEMAKKAALIIERFLKNQK